MAFVLGHGIVPHTLWNHEHLAFAKFDSLLLHLYPELSFEYKKHFIFAFMSVPRQRALNLGDLDISIIHLAHHSWRPQLSQ